MLRGPNLLDMTTIAEKAYFAADVFLRLTSNTDKRLSNGLRIRSEMADQIASGEVPDGYRAEWLKSAALRLVASLRDSAQEFNDDHYDDMISVHDMFDVLATATVLLKNATKKR